MNLTVEKVKKILAGQIRADGVRSMQYLMAQDLLKLHAKVKELEGEIDDWERLGYKK